MKNVAISLKSNMLRSSPGASSDVIVPPAEL